MSMQPWCSPSPESAARLLASAGVPWWLAGGWAIDLFVGHARRTHADLDIGCFREDVRGVFDAIADWEIHVSASGTLTRVERGAVLPHGAHTLWSRPPSSPCWVLELLIEEAEKDHWVYRRDGRIRRHRADIVAHTTDGLCYVRPEIHRC